MITYYSPAAASTRWPHTDGSEREREREREGLSGEIKYFIHTFQPHQVKIISGKFTLASSVPDPEFPSEARADSNSRPTKADQSNSRKV
jgi:hypothetical protein